MTVPVVATRRSWQPLAAAAGVFVLVVATAVWLVLRAGGEVAGAASAATTIPAAPPGFATHQGRGFTIAVPKDWHQEEDGEIALWPSSSDPRHSAVLIVERWDDRPYLPTARDVLGDYEDTDFSTNSISNYKRIRFDDKPAPDGVTIAELEATYHVDDEFEIDVHDLLHTVVTDDGQTVVITLATQTTDPATTEQLWQQSQDTFATILGSFHLTP
jgi:hypothetical protein